MQIYYRENTSENVEIPVFPLTSPVNVCMKGRTRFFSAGTLEHKKKPKPNLWRLSNATLKELGQHFITAKLLEFNKHHTFISSSVRVSKGGIFLRILTLYVCYIIFDTKVRQLSWA